MRDLRGASWLALSLIRRTLREGIVLRSLLVPGAIATLGTLITLVSVSWWTAPLVVGVESGVSSEVVERLRESEVEILEIDDAASAVQARLASVAIGVDQLVVDLRTNQPLGPEGAARRALRTSWRPMSGRRSQRERIPPAEPAQNIVRLLGLLFCLYGVVFGAGGIARDRAEGLLDTELASGLSHAWVGLARWSAAVVVISVPLALSVAVLNVILWVEGTPELIAHCTAGIATSVALGMSVVGGASIDRSFGTVLAYGLGALATLIALGQNDALSAYIPVGSIMGTGAGTPIGPVLLLGLVAVGLGILAFVRRVATT